jgi:hypothetical protein
MKTNPLVSILLGVLLLGAIATFITAILYEKQYRKLRVLQTRIQQVQYYRAVIIPALAADTVEYAKHNPAIDPILQAAGVQVAKPAAQSNVKPQAK